jgi:citrate lyase beta subunit
LFVPGNREDLLAKAPGYGADALVLDLEDSVPVKEKDRARSLVRAFIAEHQSTLNYVRVNAIHTGMLEADLEAIVVDGLSTIRLAKTESADTVRAVDSMLSVLEARRGSPSHDRHRHRGAPCAPHRTTADECVHARAGGNDRVVPRRSVRRTAHRPW